MEKYVKAAVATEYYNFSHSQIRKLAREGKIPVKQTPGGQYLYLIQEDLVEKPKKKNFIYCRISSKKYFDKLQDQISFLKEKYPEYEVIQDIGSGMNYDRDGFKIIIEHLLNRNINHVVVTSKDRFTRFGFDFFEWMFEKMNANLTSENEENDKNEKIDQMMETLTFITAEYYGKEKLKKRLKKIFI